MLWRRENYNFIVTKVDANITELSVVLESNANGQVNGQMQLNLLWGIQAWKCPHFDVEII